MYQKSWWYDLRFFRYRVWLTEIGNYGSFVAFFYAPLKTPQKSEFWKYSHFTHVHQKPKSYEVWLLRYVRQTESFVILGHFLPYNPPNNLVNENFEKMTKASEDAIISDASWDMECDRDNFLPFGTIFCSLTLPTIWKNYEKILKKWKKCPEISFYTCLPYMKIIWYKGPEIWSTTDRIFSNFGPFFALLPS